MGSENMGKKNKIKKRGAGPLSIICLILAMILFVYGIVVLSQLGTSNWFNFVWIIGGGIFMLLSFLFSRTLGMPVALKVILVVIILACLSNFAIFAYHMTDAMNVSAAYDAKWVIVLGAKVNGVEPSREFNERIIKAAEYLRYADAAATLAGRKGPMLIATGGQGEDEGMSEGEVCSRVLQTLGVSEDRIIIDNQSTTTLENFGYAKALIESNGGSEKDKTAVVTSGFHLYRAMKLAETSGFSNISGYGSTGLTMLIPHYIFREYAAFIKEVSLGHIAGNPLPF